MDVGPSIGQLVPPRINRIIPYPLNYPTIQPNIEYVPIKQSQPYFYQNTVLEPIKQPALVTVEEHSNYYLYIFLIFIILIIIILVIIWFCWDTSHVEKKLHCDCKCNNDCLPGHICDNGKCKIPIGGYCSNLSDCVGNATACYDGICTNSILGNIGDKPPCQPNLINNYGKCKVPIGGICSKRSDCVDSAGSCIEGICTISKRRLGDKCSAKNKCDDGYKCDYNICLISNKSFIPCNSDDNCAGNGICKNHTCLNKYNYNTSYSIYNNDHGHNNDHDNNNNNDHDNDNEHINDHINIDNNNTSTEILKNKAFIEQSVNSIYNSMIS